MTIREDFLKFAETEALSRKLRIHLHKRVDAIARRYYAEHLANDIMRPNSIKSQSLTTFEFFESLDGKFVACQYGWVDTDGEDFKIPFDYIENMDVLLALEV